MFFKLFLAFTLIPAIELYLLMSLGAIIGPLNTVLLILVTGVIGAGLAKREGFSVLLSLQTELQQGLPPAERLMEGALIVVGGILLITPGVLTDAIGFSLILPLTRRRIAPRLLARFSKNIHIRTTGTVGAAETVSASTTTAQPSTSSTHIFEHPEA